MLIDAKKNRDDIPLQPRAAAAVPSLNTAKFSKTWTFLDGDWHEGNVAIMGARTHAAWLGSMVFDGARAFEGVAPDLALHCARVNASAVNFQLKPLVSIDQWLDLVADGRKRFDRDAQLYIRPMYWAEQSGAWVRLHDPESTRWCLSIYEAPLREQDGFSVALSPFRRPTLDTIAARIAAEPLEPS